MKLDIDFTSELINTHVAPLAVLSALDELTLKNIEQLQARVNAIRRVHSPLSRRDWRPFLWLDFDLTSLPCGPKAQASLKGYFGEKKSPGAAVSSGECHC